MRFLFYLLLSLSLLCASSIENKIKKNKKALSSKKTEYKKMDRQLSSIAKNISMAKKEQRKLASKLSVLSKNIKTNEVKFKQLQKENKAYNKSLRHLNISIEKNQKKFLKLLAKNFSLSLALEELNQPTEESIIMKEVYKVYEKRNSEEIGNLSKEIKILDGKKNILQSKKTNIKKVIMTYEKERQEYNHKKGKQDKIVASLARDKAIYEKRFNKIRASRKNLERKLAKLKIIKRSDDEAKKVEYVSKIHGQSSMNTAKTTTFRSKYKGTKTISPLRGARLIKKFGTYIDPIYKFKIFNKSITLKAPHTGSKVRSVLPGKVVFAENSGGMLGKVVIIEHANKIHTIYAKLSRLAPGVHVGKKLSIGTIIGKVDKSLMFEVTKSNKHMNPLKLIRL